MKVLRICPNEAEAGFIASLLEAEGIVSFSSDAGVQLSGPAHVRLEVSEEDYDRALSLIAHEEAKRTPDQAQTTAIPLPSAGYPFLGIAGFVMILFVASVTLLNLWRFHEGMWEAGTSLAGVIGVSISTGAGLGFLVGCVIAFFGLIARPLIMKIKGGEPGATDNPDDAQR